MENFNILRDFWDWLLSHLAYDILKSLFWAIGSGILLATSLWLIQKIRRNVDYVVIAIMFIFGGTLMYLSNRAIDSTTFIVIVVELIVVCLFLVVIKPWSQRSMEERNEHISIKSSSKQQFTMSEMQEKISIFLFGSPQLYITPGKLFTIETIYFKIVNLLPFPIEFENLKADILLDGSNLATKDANISLIIASNSIGEVYLRHDLTDNQAEIARNYREQYSNCPFLKIAAIANFRTPQGLLPIRFETQIRCFIY